MSIATLSSHPFFGGLDAKKIHTGRTGVVFFRPEVYPITRGGQFATHSILGNSRLKGAQGEQILTFEGGASAVSAVAQVETLVVEAQPAVGDTLTVVGNLATIVYSFIANGGTPGAGEIEIGANAAGTAANISDEVTADVGTLGIASAVDTSTTVVFTGASSGAFFRVLPSVPSKLSVTHTTAGVAAVSATLGKIELKVVQQRLTPYTKTRFSFNGIPTPDGETSYTLDLWVEVASGDTEQSYLGRVRSMLLSLLSNNPLTEPDRMYYNQSLELTRAEIATSLVALFGAVGTAESNIVLTGTGSSAKLTLNAASGTNGGTKYISLITAVEGSIALPKLPIIGGAINMAGWFSAGAQVDATVTTNTTTTDINADNEKFAIARPVTAQVASVTFNCLQDMDFQVQALADSTGARVMQGGDFQAMVFAAHASQKHVAIAHISEDPAEPGKYDGFLIFDATSGSGANRANGRAAIGTVPITMNPQPVGISPACPFGMFFSVNTNVPAEQV